VVAVYAGVGIAWIAFSDAAVRLLVSDPGARHLAQTVKGSLFVAVTSAILYVLVARSDRRLRALGAEVRATVDSMADAVLLVDERVRIVEANRAALQLLGAEREEDVIGPLQDWGARWHLRTADGEPVPFERFAAVRALGGDAHAHYDGILRRADGADVFVSVSASPVELPGARRLVVVVLRDVSPARRLDEAREDFLAAAAHELKTPLAVVKAYAQLMARREPAEARALGVIQRQVDRMSGLVQHLLDASRLRLEPAIGAPERFDLALLAREVAARVRAAAPRHALTVDAAGPAPVVADRARIARVIEALLENGVRFSPEGGPVQTRVEAADGHATLSVRDGGLGIPPDRQGRVFERFYRAHAGTPADPGGLGVGLEVSRDVVERHGGRMWFESAPGEGSTFHFTLPLAEGPA
jgi:PAS domain S-box-containing protein